MNEAREHFHPSVTEKATAQSVPAPLKDVHYARQGQGTRAGDKIDALARYHIKRWNAKELVTALRERRLSITEYRHFITRMYPLVVGFNGGLIQSITKIEELQQSVQDRLTLEVLSALMEARTPDAFPNTSFPQPILAICHYLKRAAVDPEVKFLIYYAIQSGIEFALVKAISESVFPGVAGTRDQLQLNPELVPDADVTESGSVPLSIKWFDEHADYGQGGRAELQHVRHGREQLNRNLIEEADVKEALRRVDEVLLLWSAV